MQSILTLYRSIIRNPKYRGWVILGTLFYLLSPLDISPDVVPLIGQIDDVVLLTLLVSEVYQMMVDYTRGLMGQSAAVSKNSEDYDESNPSQTIIDVEATKVE